MRRPWTMDGRPGRLAGGDEMVPGWRWTLPDLGDRDISLRGNFEAL
jgi:hypothetical protein